MGPSIHGPFYYGDFWVCLAFMAIAWKVCLIVGMWRKWKQARDWRRYYDTRPRGETMEPTIKCEFICKGCGRSGWFDVRQRRDGENVVKYVEMVAREAGTAHALAGGLMCEEGKVDLKMPVSKDGIVGRPAGA